MPTLDDKRLGSALLSRWSGWPMASQAVTPVVNVKKKGNGARACRAWQHHGALRCGVLQEQKGKVPKRCRHQGDDEAVGLVPEIVQLSLLKERARRQAGEENRQRSGHLNQIRGDLICSESSIARILFRSRDPSIDEDCRELWSRIISGTALTSKILRRSQRTAGQRLGP